VGLMPRGIGKTRADAVGLAGPGAFALAEGASLTIRPSTWWWWPALGRSTSVSKPSTLSAVLAERNSFICVFAPHHLLHPFLEGVYQLGG